jgi:hypothetical protein
MHSIRNIFCVSLFALSFNAWSYGIGVSTFPMMTDKKWVTGEFTGIASDGGGVGLQARYSQKLNSALMIDAGAGFGGGDRSNRIFAGADFEILPDYMNQPRVSIKSSLINAREFDTRRNILSIAPTISKGFSFWGNEAYPFMSIPLGLSLENGSKTYETIASVNLGIAGHLPIEGYRHLMGNIEGTFNLKDSYSGVFFGVSYPLN